MRMWRQQCPTYCMSHGVQVQGPVHGVTSARRFRPSICPVGKVGRAHQPQLQSSRAGPPGRGNESDVHSCR
eukprot:15451727-Alexandrium_andersonii.AAC.1